MDRIVEQWRPVVGWEGFYEVSDQGRVRSVDRHILYSNGKTCTWRGRILRQSLGAKRYYKVALSRNSRGVTRMVHLLVLEAFIGPRPHGMEGCHFDGNPFNNKLSNLRWDTPMGNSLDKVRHGTMSQGSRCGPAVLDEYRVLQIRSRHFVDPCTHKSNRNSLAKEFGVTPSTIGYIVRRRTWRHI